jgi:phosphate starvation-inducible PhoH-like protein
VQIQKSLKNKHGQKNHEIPVVSSSVFMFKQEVPIDPYVLGCLLGDGNITGGSIHFTTADPEVLDLIRCRLPKDFTISLNAGSRSGYDYYITNKSLRGSSRNIMKTSLRNLGLWGHKAHEKFIPEIYLKNDLDTRLALLRGLMDTDGSVYSHRSGKSRTEFYSVSQQLAKDVKFLVESLGGVARLRLRSKPKNGTHRSGFGHKYDCYTVDMILPATINPFLLKRKAALFVPSPLMRLISDVVDVGEEECQCISVDAPDHLYLTGDFIVTHNTFNNCFIILDEAQNATLDQLKMVTTRLGENCKLVVGGDPDQSDLSAGKKSSLRVLSDILKDVLDIGIVELEEEDIVRHPIVKEVVRAFQRYSEEK